MGTSPGLGVSEAHSKMRAIAFVLLAAVAVNADADADAYTVGQVAHGFTNGGVVTGVDYGHGVVSGYGAIGNRPVTHVAGVHPVNTVAGVYSAHPINTVAGVTTCSASVRLRPSPRLRLIPSSTPTAWSTTLESTTLTLSALSLESTTPMLSLPSVLESTAPTLSPLSIPTSTPA